MATGWANLIPEEDFIELFLAEYPSVIGRKPYSDNTKTNYRSDLHTFLKYCRRIPVKILDVQPQELARYFDTMPLAKGKALSESSKQRYRSAIKAFYDFAVRSNAIQRSPTAVLAFPSIADDSHAKMKSVSTDELRAMIYAEDVSPRHLLYVALLGINGLYLEEIERLQVEDYDDSSNPPILRISGRRGDRDSFTVLPPLVADRVKACIQERKSGPLITDINGGSFDKDVQRRAVSLIAKRASVIGKVSPSMVRNAMIVIALRAGCLPPSIAKAVNLSQVRLWQRYRIAGLEDAVHPAVRVLQALDNPMPNPRLRADDLHHVVWAAADKAWENGQRRDAVQRAGTAVDEMLQHKLNRFDKSGDDLVTLAFKLDPPRPGEPRLRFAEFPANSKNFVSAHRGAMNFGQGCMAAIRNLATHSLTEPDPQIALERLAALSVFARLIDDAQVVMIDGAQVVVSQPEV